MQNVRVLSSLTNERIHVTPSSAFRSTTPRQRSAPPFATGVSKPSGKVRCTTSRGKSFLQFGSLGMPRTYEQPRSTASAGPPTSEPHATYLGLHARALGNSFEGNATTKRPACSAPDLARRSRHRCSRGPIWSGSQRRPVGTALLWTRWRRRGRGVVCCRFAKQSNSPVHLDLRYCFRVKATAPHGTIRR